MTICINVFDPFPIKFKNGLKFNGHDTIFTLQKRKNQSLFSGIRIKKALEFENCPTPDIKNGVF